MYSLSDDCLTRESVSITNWWISEEEWFFIQFIIFSSLGDVLSSILCKQNRKEIINLYENDKKTHDL